MGDPVKVEWTGDKELIAKINRHRDAMPQILASVLYMEGEECMSASKPLVPVLHGFLRASGFVQLPVLDGPTVTVELGFGGVAGAGNQDGETNDQPVGYAVYVHEDLTAHHTVGQAKFLEQPFNERKESMSERMGGRIEAKLNALG